MGVVGVELEEMIVGEGAQYFLWSAAEEPGEFSNRVGLFTWQQLMIVQQTT